MNLDKFFCTLSGEDYDIILNCHKGLHLRFMAIGAFVLCIFFMCFASCYLLFTELFHNYFLGVSLSLVFASMIVTIYLLLLYTLTKNVLPHVKKKSGLIVSISLRILFIVLIALSISKPLELWIKSGQVSSDIELFKVKEKAKYEKIITQFYQSRIDDLQKVVQRDLTLHQNDLSLISGGVAETIERLRIQRDSEVQEMNNLIENSNYYFKGIVIMGGKYPDVWIITFISIVIFLIPAALKQLVHEESDFYTIREKIEKNIVRDEYAEFKFRFSEIFRNNFGVEKVYVEKYQDPPFNTIPKTDDTKYLTGDDLIKELYKSE